MVELDVGTLRRTRKRFNRWTVAAAAAAALLVLLASLLGLRAYLLRDAVLPGVTVAGVQIGGLERDEARARIAAALGAALDRPVEVETGGRALAVVPGELYRVDAAATEEAAFAAGRESLLAQAAALAAPFGFERAAEPVLAVRPAGQAALAERLDDLSQPAVSATVAMDGTHAVVKPGRAGSSVDPQALAASLREAALAGETSVTARLVASEPALTTSEATRAAAQAELIASAPIRLRLEGEPIGRLSRATLASLVRFRPADGGVEAVLGRAALGSLLAPMTEGLMREPVDARFRIEGKRASVVRAKPGTTLDLQRAADVVRSAGLTGFVPRTRVAAIPLTSVPAELTTRDARALGIKRRVATFTTDMGVSSANRVTNVLLLGEYLDGTIVKPGEVFSFNGTVGPRTPERGFVEGSMILGGILVPSIGGGVCQVATTIFNTAFEAGVPIRDRTNHSFYISHYPVGRDAAVSWGGPDLVFRNDLEHAILIKASGDASTFTVSFYGTREGRKVIATTSTPTNYTSPTLQYAVDPSAPAGSVRTASGGGPGFDVNVHRKVVQDGKVIREDDFFTRYTPQNPTRIYGPGQTPPGPYFTVPSSA